LFKGFVSRASFLQYLAGAMLLIAFIGSVGPMLLIPFVTVLPYLQKWSLLERLFCSVLLWSTAIFLYLAVSTPQQKHSVSSVAFRGLKDKSGAFLGLIMFVCSAAALSANTFGSLVKMFPNQSYLARFEVAAAVSSGAKYKMLDLDLKSNQDGRAYYLTLSKRLFADPKLQPGDILLLKGKQNFFGVYIEEVEKIAEN
jgi:hypothetical protein